MLEPDFDVKWSEKIILKIEGGSFLCKSIYKEKTLLFNNVDGRLNDIYADYRYFKTGRFMYWHIELIDNENGNTYVICFPYTSAMFQSIILRLATATSFENIQITPYQDKGGRGYQRREHSKVKVSADGVELQMLPFKLPKIDCFRIGTQVRKNYTQRIASIAKIIDTILRQVKNASTRARGKMA